MLFMQLIYNMVLWRFIYMERDIAENNLLEDTAEG